MVKVLGETFSIKKRTQGDVSQIITQVKKDLFFFYQKITLLYKKNTL